MAAARIEAEGYEEARIHVCAGNLRDAEAALARARTELEQAQARHGAKLKEHERAAEAHTESPTDRNAKRVLEARDTLHLTEIPVHRAEVAVESASSSVETARRALADAEQVAAAAARARRIVELKRAASIETFDADAGHVGRKILEHWKAIEALADEADRAFCANFEACAELRQLGEPIANMHHIHLLKGFLLALVDERPELVELMLRHFWQLAYPVEPTPARRPGMLLRGAIAFPLLEQLSLKGNQPAARSPDIQARQLLVLTSALCNRTQGEIEQVLRAGAAMQAPSSPPPAPTAPEEHVEQGADGHKFLRRVFRGFGAT